MQNIEDHVRLVVGKTVEHIIRYLCKKKHHRTVFASVLKERMKQKKEKVSRTTKTNRVTISCS